MMGHGIKAGVVLGQLAPQWAVAYPIIQAIYHERGYACVITCGNEAHEDRPGSLHPSGRALDFRTRHLPMIDKIEVHKAIKEALGEQWDVLLENVAKDSEHLHCEYDPKPPRVMEA